VSTGGDPCRVERLKRDPQAGDGNGIGRRDAESGWGRNRPSMRVDRRVVAITALVMRPGDIALEELKTAQARCLRAVACFGDTFTGTRPSVSQSRIAWTS
jgi:hypothetical protein